MRISGGSAVAFVRPHKVQSCIGPAGGCTEGQTMHLGGRLDRRPRERPETGKMLDGWSASIPSASGVEITVKADEARHLEDVLIVLLGESRTPAGERCT